MEALKSILQATIPAPAFGIAKHQIGQKTLNSEYHAAEKLTCIKHGEYNASFKSPITGAWITRTGCPECRKEEYEQQKRQQEEIELKSIIERNCALSGVPKRYLSKRIADVQETAVTAKPLKWLRRYLEVLDERLGIGASGSLYGDCGTGKTLMGCTMVNEIISRGYKARYITAWQMIQIVRQGYSQSELSTIGQVRSFINPDFLVIDEIGVQTGSQDERVLLYQVIDGRYNEMKSTLIISNLKDPVADGYLDARVIDRLKENDGFSLGLVGSSYRGV